MVRNARRATLQLAHRYQGNHEAHARAGLPPNPPQRGGIYRDAAPRQRRSGAQFFPIDQPRLVRHALAGRAGDHQSPGFPEALVEADTRVTRTIAYLAGSFPLRSETFVYREVRALREREWSVRACSLHKPEDVPAALKD